MIISPIKKPLKIIAVLILGLSILCISACSLAKEKSDELPLRIYHACGITETGQTETNSIDALEHSYKEGVRCVELDFIRTSDEYMVCCHDWTSRYSVNKTGMDIPDYETFLEYHDGTYGYLSPTLDELALWLQNHKEMKVVTDIKDRNCEGLKQVCELHPEIECQLIPQIYSYEEYADVVALGFDNIYLTLYKMTDEERRDIETLKEFLQNSPCVKAVVTSAMSDNIDVIQSICDIDIPCFVHTVNSESEETKWHEMGVYGIYTDSLGLL